MRARYRDAMARLELAHHEQLLEPRAGNTSLAARLANRTRKEIYDALRRLGLDARR